MVEAGIVVSMHASDSGYTRYTNEWEGVQGEDLAFGEPKLLSAVVEGDYEILDERQEPVARIVVRGGEGSQEGAREPRGQHGEAHPRSIGIASGSG